MYILMISRGVPTRHNPQWGCFERDQAEALVSIGHKVVVMSIDSRLQIKLRKIGTKITFLNDVHYYDYHIISGKLLRIFGDKFRIFCLKRQVEHLFKIIKRVEGVPDVIYGQFFFNTVLGVWIKKQYGIPLVGIEHAARFNSDKLDVKTYEAAQYAYNNTDAIITVSNSLKERIRHHFGKDSIVIHNTASPYFFKHELNFERKDKRYSMIAIGSLIYRKGFDLLIRALTNLNIPRSSWALKIIGEGEERNNLQNLIDSCGLVGNIELLGQLPRNEIAQILMIVIFSFFHHVVKTFQWQ